MDANRPVELHEPRPEPAPIDAAESRWDPWLYALYVAQIAEEVGASAH